MSIGFQLYIWREGGSEGSVGREYSHASSGEMGGGEEREGHRQVSMKPFESSDALLFYPDGKGMGDEEIFAKEHFRMDGRDFNRVLDGDEVLGVPQSSHYEAHTPGSESTHTQLSRELPSTTHV